MYDFLKFVTNKKEEIAGIERKIPTQESQVFMNFDIEATPEARFQLIYNSQIGDMIRAQGSGNFQLGIDPDYSYNFV